jgi:predicted enzyme related to lactoylglutathione lyase
MEKETVCSNDFPIQGVELTCMLVVSDYARALTFYRDVLGATVIHELAPTLCDLRFAGINANVCMYTTHVTFW